MVRTVKLLIGLVVVGLSGALIAAYTGVAESVVSPSQLPGNPGYAFAGVIVLVFVGLLLTAYLDSRAWAKMGRKRNLTAEKNLNPFSNDDLTGTVRGRPVRARTESEGGGRNSSSTTYTVVEAELQSPVEWTATFAVNPDEEAEDVPDLGANQFLNVDDQFVVWGDVSESHAREILSGQVRTTLLDLDSKVAVGDVEANLRNAMLESLEEDASGMSGKLAKGMLSMGSDGEQGPTTTVMHRDRGKVLDEDELDRRIEAVTAVADAVERVSAATR